MNRNSYREGLEAAAYQGRHSLDRYLRRHRDLFTGHEWDAYLACVDVGRLYYAVLQEMRHLRGLPSDPNCYHQHPTVAGEVVRSLCSPSGLYRFAGFRKAVRGKRSALAL